MKQGFLQKGNIVRQIVTGILLIAGISLICYALSSYMGYKVVALILLVVVSCLAMFFDIVPVLLVALLSALTWDFFFIPPTFKFTIGSPEDMLMFLMYFVIATLNGVLTYKIRQMEKETMKKEEKERTLKLYSTLLNSLSHELRTPISTIIAATDNLQTNDERLTEQNKTELVSEISKASFRLNRQVENLLNMSRLDSGFIQPKLDWVDIAELIYGVVRNLEELKITQEIRVNISPDIPLFRLDKGMMEQVLYNLVLNALQYTPAKSVVEISALCNKDTLEIIVKDNGKGFPAEEIQKVFEKFYRLKNSRPGGTGLGLSIAKGFVEAQNGTIFLENLPGGGAKFTIEISAETSYINSLKNE